MLTADSPHVETALIDVRSLTVSFGTRKVLDGFTHVFKAGMMTAVIGPSGAGKSTLLAVLLGHVRPDDGDVVLDGLDRHQMATVFQRTAVLGGRTVIDNVAVGALATGLGIDEARDRARELLPAGGLEVLVHAKARTLSGGERQRLTILRAIAQGASFLLADEPTASLDARNRSLVVDALQGAAASGAGVIVCTHDEYVAEHADHVVSLW